MAVFKRESNTITLATFWELYQLGKYDFSPGYQRESVWSEEKQSFLIDSILKNIPIPPIFLHQTIDDVTGSTTFAVIDGKQRLTSIINFINGLIPSSSEGEDSPLYVEELAGLEFNDLNSEELIETRRAFWRYSIPIEYIDTDEKLIIDSIFDRLNRNGEPLEGQELRRANYYGSELLETIESLSMTEFWKARLLHVDVKRMEDREFVSEILFYLLEGSPLKSDQNELDKLYKQYAEQDKMNWARIKGEFIDITAYMSSLNLDYERHKITGVSHLYALWGLCIYCLREQIPHQFVADRLNVFYEELRSGKELNESHSSYKKSMASSTRMKSARVKRFEALKSCIVD